MKKSYFRVTDGRLNEFDSKTHQCIRRHGAVGPLLASPKSPTPGETMSRPKTFDLESCKREAANQKFCRRLLCKLLGVDEYTPDIGLGILAERTRRNRRFPKNGQAILDRQFKRAELTEAV